MVDEGLQYHQQLRVVMCHSARSTHCIVLCHNWLVVTRHQQQFNGPSILTHIRYLGHTQVSLLWSNY